ncbi:MAG: DUF1538 domain-containing protein, partial [Deltaproteobacteria bacterium]|nr:DUF1538 domain-containing protein [Deltaproteobacteria bacterium]
TVFGWSLRWVLIISYTALFIACGFMDAGFVGLAFDGGGVSTGPITVPFVIAVGLGMAAATRKKESADNSFGMAAIASIGPAAALAVMGLVSTASVGSVAYEAAPYVEMPILARCLGLLPEVAMEIFMALSPIFISLLIFQALLLKLPAQQVIRMITGLVYTFIGLVIFMLGVKSGFMLAGESLGNALGGTAGGLVLIPVGLILGAVVVCAEPAVWVLTAQVEEVSGGHIKRSIMFTVLSLSVAIAVCLGMVRVVFGFSIWWLLLPGYALALIFTKFCPPLFTGIAFDSGSVCTGPMAGTVVLALTLGGAAAVGGNPAVDGFGMVAMIALAPPIAIQLLGMLFQYKKKQAMNSTTTTGTAQ